MNNIILFCLLFFCPSLVAGGTWGGGTPPLSYNGLTVTTTAAPMKHTVIMGEETIMPRVSANSLVQLGDGVILLAVSDKAYVWIVKKILRVGEATLVLDDGRIFQFVNKNCFPIDVEQAARVVNIDSLAGTIPECISE